MDEQEMNEECMKYVKGFYNKCVVICRVVRDTTSGNLITTEMQWFN